MMILNTKNVIGFKLNTIDGDIGKVQDIYFDDRNWKLRYITVETGTWFFGNQVAIDCNDIKSVLPEKNNIIVNLSREDVKNSAFTDKHKPVYQQMQDQSFQSSSWLSFGGAGMGYPSSGMVKGISQSEEHLKLQKRYDIHLRSCEHIGSYKLHDKEGIMAEVTAMFFSTKDWTIKYFVYKLIEDLAGRKYIIKSNDISAIDFENRSLITSGVFTLREDLK